MKNTHDMNHAQLPGVSKVARADRRTDDRSAKSTGRAAVGFVSLEAAVGFSLSGVIFS